MPKRNTKLTPDRKPLKQDVVQQTVVSDEDFVSENEEALDALVLQAQKNARLGGWLYNQYAEKIKDISVDIDPVSQPNVATAISRLFGPNAPMIITADMYLQLIEYQEGIEDMMIEQSEDEVSWEDVTGDELTCEG